ncbi:MAG: hypothetical protein IKM85_06730 [Bacteroidales bacterium]|nr:hypothetical protein [Bacteroidales bacterium]
MMHFLTVYSTQGKNSLQKFLVAEADKWKCTLVDDDLGPDGEAKRACIEHFRKMLDTANQQFPKCTPCQFATGENHIAFQTPDGLDSFVQITFKRVLYVYDGIDRMKSK